MPHAGAAGLSWTHSLLHTRSLGPVGDEDKTCMQGVLGNGSLPVQRACPVQQAVHHTRGPTDMLYKMLPWTGSKRSLLR